MESYQRPEYVRSEQEEILKALEIISNQLWEWTELYRATATASLQMMKDNCPHKDELEGNCH